MRCTLVLLSALVCVGAANAAQQPVSLAPPAASAVTSRDMERASRTLAHALHEALLRNGTLEEARQAYEANPVGGGEVVALQCMLADCLRVQRIAFRQLLAAADRLPAVPAGFARRQLILELLDRMVAFRKANRKLGRAGQASLPSPSLPRLMDALDRTLAEMDRRIGELRPLVESAL